jgi:putative DNA primase/helicase
MSYANEDDVRRQLEDLGLKLDDATVWPPTKFGAADANTVRTKFEGKRTKAGWYHLYNDAVNKDGERIITGAYGYWEGTYNHSQTVIVGKADLPKLTDDQKADKRRAAAAAAKKAKNIEKARLQKASLRAQWVWTTCRRRGEAEYHTRKQIQPMGVRYSPESWGDIIPTLPNDLFPPEMLWSPQNTGDDKIKLPPTNSIIVPLQDESGTIHMLQAIMDRATHRTAIKRMGTDKILFPLGGGLAGKYHQIGPMITTIALIAEGYSTAVTLHLATGLPVIIVFSASNIKNVLEVLLPYYKDTQFLICADDDDLQSCQACKGLIQLTRCKDGACHLCGASHLKTNTGIEAAFRACTEPRVKYIRPKFPNQDDRYARYAQNKGKLTDFNDLHVSDSLSAVRSQLEKALVGLAWTAGNVARVQQTRGGGEDDDDYQECLRIKTVAEALDNIWLIYGTSLVFDERHKMIYKLSAFYDSCASSDITKQWRESDYRKKVKLEHIGFDPQGTDKNIICNLWDSWPITPVEGDCDLILDLILYLCSGEGNAVDLSAWFIKWLAYPLQHPGAKMQTTAVFYGPQGAGKDLMGDAIKAMYGKYGGKINQRALETQFNEFLSKKLFIIANEVASGSDQYEMKNALKTFISDTEIWINPKGVAAYFEANHVNIMFFSNERKPVVLEEDDRRHLVVWTPPPRDVDYYWKVAQQVKNGGVEALYHYLLSIDLGDFNEHSKPPMTIAKQELIDLSKGPALRFFDAWSRGEIEGAPFVPIQKPDLYKFFKLWCHKTGHRGMPDSAFFDRLSKIPGTTYLRKRFYKYEDDKWKECQRSFYFFPSCEDRSFQFTEEANWTKDFTERLRVFLDKYKGDDHE